MLTVEEEIEKMEMIKIDDIPFKYEQTRVYLKRYPIENLSDLLLGIGPMIVLQYFFLKNPRYLVDIEDTVNREYGESMFEHVAGFDFDRQSTEKPSGLCILVRNIIEAYKEGREYDLMPLERLQLAHRVWLKEQDLNHCYHARKIFLKHHKPGEEEKVFGWWPTAEYLEEEENELVKTIKAVEDWDKEHGYDSGQLYI